MERTSLESSIRLLLDTLELEEVFEVLDMTPYEVIMFLHQQGQVDLPEWLTDVTTFIERSD